MIEKLSIQLNVKKDDYSYQLQQFRRLIVEHQQSILHVKTINCYAFKIV